MKHTSNRGNMDVVIAANAFCIRAHAGQKRAQGTPYHEHPQAVRQLLMALCDACDVVASEDLQAAALLHDVIEDTDATSDILEREFNETIADWVHLLSKPVLDVGNKKLRDDAYYKRLLDANDDSVRLLEIADRLHNLSELYLVDNEKRVRSYLDATLSQVLPLATHMHDERLRLGTTAAMLEAMRCSTRASHIPALQYGIEDPAAPTHQSALPLGVCAVVEVTPQTDHTIFYRRVDEVLLAGIRVLLLQSRELSIRALHPIAEKLLEKCQQREAILLVDGRADLAWLIGAHGVVLGLTDLPAAGIRALSPPGFLIANSTNTSSQFQNSLEQERLHRGLLDCIFVEPVFRSRDTQKGAPDVGSSTFTQHVQESDLPVVGGGGVETPLRIASVARSGGHMATCKSALEPTQNEGRSTALASTILQVAFFAARAQRGLPRRQ
ncbi:MAG: HD domain-containing protein [Deltaproteobacteria bacterium]|nr:HD domain-containing protein [Deltaproteobacteria bacterium]